MRGWTSAAYAADFDPLRPYGRRPTSPTDSVGNFNPLRPQGTETPERLGVKHPHKISILSAHVGRDAEKNADGTLRYKFHPAPPVWAETNDGFIIEVTSEFQPAPPVWAETFLVQHHFRMHLTPAGREASSTVTA